VTGWDLPRLAERLADVLIVNHILREVCARIRSIEQPLQFRPVIDAEPAEEFGSPKLVGAGLDPAIQSGHASERGGIESAEPEQRTEMFTPRLVQQ
jgi:hypothetical protein